MFKRAFYEPIWQWYGMLEEYEVRTQRHIHTSTLSAHAHNSTVVTEGRLISFRDNQDSFTGDRTVY
jgi:hypothetical protein